MAEKKPVTLTKDGRDITVTVPQEVVEFKAAGWREKKPTAKPETPHVTAPGPVPQSIARTDAPSGSKESSK